MNSLLGLIIQIIGLYQFALLIYIIATWLVSFNVINTSNRFVYIIIDALYKSVLPIPPSLPVFRSATSVQADPFHDSVSDFAPLPSPPPPGGSASRRSRR